MPQSRGNNGEIRKSPDFSKPKAAVMPDSSVARAFSVRLPSQISRRLGAISALRDSGTNHRNHL
jgi:hypothetical protein